MVLVKKRETEKPKVGQMRFSKLVSFMRKVKPSNGRLVVIIPCFDEQKLLLRHLSFLAAQTFQEFDVLIVLGSSFPHKELLKILKKKNYKFGLAVAKRSRDTGSAGGFFTGQVYALQKQYDYMVLADVDCFPKDKRLVKRLYALRKHGYVSPKTVFIGPKAKTIIPPEKTRAAYTSVAQYTLLSASLVKKYGLYYFPVYMGADDAEYAERIKEKRTFISNRVFHPFIIGQKAYSSPSVYWAYVLNTIAVIKSPRRFFLNIFRAVFSCLAMVIFFPSCWKRLGSKAFFGMLCLSFGKRMFKKMRTDFSACIFPSPCFCGKKPSQIKYRQYFAPVKAMFFHAAAKAIANFRKNALFLPSCNDMLPIAVGIMAKKAYYRQGPKKFLLISDNSNIAFHLAKLIAYAIFLPILLAIALPIVIIMKITNQPKTMHFGLKQ